jgi:hypothetical protein
MERQAGLGRSLEDVLDSLAPVEADPSAPGRVLFEPRELERQVDQLAVEIGDLRERVHLLLGLVPDAAVANGTSNGNHASPDDADAERKKKADKKKKRKKKAKKKRKEAAKQKSGDD